MADESFISINDLLEHIGTDDYLSKVLCLSVDKMINLGDVGAIIDSAVESIRKLPNPTGEENPNLREEFISYVLDNAVSRGSILMKWLNMSTKLRGSPEEISVFDSVPAILGSKCKICPYVKACTFEVMKKDSISKFSGIRSESVIGLMHNGINSVSDFQKAVEDAYMNKGSNTESAKQKLAVPGITIGKIQDFYQAAFVLSGNYDMAFNIDASERYKHIIEALSLAAAPLDFEGDSCKYETQVGPKNAVIKYMNDKSIYINGERRYGGTYLNTNLNRETSFDCGADMFKFMDEANKHAREAGYDQAYPVAFATYDISSHKRDVAALCRDNPAERFDFLLPKAIKEKVEKWDYDLKVLKDWFVKYSYILNYIRTGELSMNAITSLVDLGLIDGFKYLGGPDDDSCDVPVGDIKEDISSRKKFIARVNIFHESRCRSAISIGGVDYSLSGDTHFGLLSDKLIPELLDNVRLNDKISDKKILQLFNGFVGTDAQLELLFTNSEGLCLTNSEAAAADSILEGYPAELRASLIKQVLKTIDLCATLKPWLFIPATRYSIKYLAKTIGSIREESEGIGGDDSIKMINLISDRDRIVRSFSALNDLILNGGPSDEILKLIDNELSYLVHKVPVLFSFLIDVSNVGIENISDSEISLLQESIELFLKDLNLIADSTNDALSNYSQDDGRELMHAVNGARLALDIIQSTKESVDDRFEIKDLPNGERMVVVKAGYGGDFYQGFVNTIRDNSPEEIIDMITISDKNSKSSDE